MEAKQRILIVDDEEAILFSYRELLQGASVEVDGCMNLEKALALIRANSYSAIITDLRLSHSESNEGLQLLRHIKTHRPAIPVIVTTAYGSDAIKDEVLASGACGYFSKPVRIAEMLRVLQEMGVPAGRF